MRGLTTLTSLLALDLYDNKIDKIDGLEACLQLRYLDLSFNVIGAIENVAHLTQLEKLFLIENRLRELPPPLEFADRLVHLTYLELGGNQLRSLGNLTMPR